MWLIEWARFSVDSVNQAADSMNVISARCLVQTQGGEKEYFLASACAEVYVAPTANLTLTGFTVAGELSHTVPLLSHLIA